MKFKSVSSLLGASYFDKEKMPAVARMLEKLNHDKGPMATVRVTVTWTEKLEKHTCTGSHIQQYAAC